MDTRLLRRGIIFLSCLSLLSFSISGNAQSKGIAFKHSSQWWRNGATLDLDFLNNRYYVNGATYGSVSSLVSGLSGSFTRGSTATYIDSTGTMQTAASNVPRIDYDPVTLASSGLLVEGAATNLCTYSTAIGGTNWSNFNPSTNTLNAAVAPDGTTTATNTQNTNANSGGVMQGISISAAAGTYYTLSVWAKYAASSSAGGVYLAFRQSGGANGMSQTQTAIPVSGKWQRYQFSTTQDFADRTTLNIVIGNANATGLAAADTAGTNLLVWGAQLEAAATASSFIPTTASSASRSADALSLPTASWLNATAGTLLVNQQYTSNVTCYDPIIGVSQADSFGIQYQGPYGNNITNFVNGSASASSGSLSSSGVYRTASTYSSTQNQISRNGSAAVSNATSKSLTNATTLYIGRDFNSSRSYSKHVNRVVYFGIEMPAASLADFTR